ncbi:hypothetical protein [Rothia uropygialis]|uniref:hypothetical protein n=1 Tax=Kocuria sp. 36 TaxID=1415402 RepID=UPI00101DF881|nr:hypothetical protein [Kocuria sp. 36]
MVAFVFVFGALFSIDSETTLGFGDIAWFKNSEEDADPQKFHDSLTSTAKQRGLNIAKIGADPERPETGQHLEMVIGNPELPSAHWPDSGYPAFNLSQGVSVAVREHPDADPLG